MEVSFGTHQNGGCQDLNPVLVLRLFYDDCSIHKVYIPSISRVANLRFWKYWWTGWSISNYRLGCSGIIFLLTKSDFAS